MKTFLAFTIAFLCLFTDHVKACSCGSKATVELSVKNSDAVFIGKVISVQHLSFIDSSEENTKPLKVMFAKYDFLVTSLYKGDFTNDTVSVYTGIGNGDCGIIFHVGRKYIVYGYDESWFIKRKGYRQKSSNNGTWTHLCLRTTYFNRKELKEIKKYAKKTKKIPRSKQLG